MMNTVDTSVRRRRMTSTLLRIILTATSSKFWTSSRHEASTLAVRCFSLFLIGKLNWLVRLASTARLA